MPIRDKIEKSVIEIIKQLDKHGYEAYLVGGAVRDLLFNRQPKDYDIATSASPEEIRKVFGRSARIIGRRFRLVHVYHGSDVYEVSTFRREPTEEERRGRINDKGKLIWRDNQFGSLEQDAWRRDFTVNALYFDPLSEPGIIDFIAGKKDLDDAIVKAIGDPKTRLEEDPVRMLRALKLVGQYDFTLEENLDSCLRSGSQKIQLSSSVRLFEEIIKILKGQYSLPILTACHEYGLLKWLLPTMATSWNSVEGDFLQKLLKARDKQIALDTYSKSKALIVATLALPTVFDEIGGNIVEGKLWENGGGFEKMCRSLIQKSLSPLPVSRFLSSRARDIILLQSRLMSCNNRNKIIVHPEYKYAWSLFSILHEVLDLPQEILEYWPKPAKNTSEPRKKYKRKPQHKHHIRRRRGR